MPLYDYRTEAQDGSGHFRQGTQQADSKEHARLVIEERERDFAAFRLSDEHRAELLEAYGADVDELPQAAPVDASEGEKDAFRVLHVKHRAWVNLHRQEKPYKLVDLKESKKEEAA